MFILKVINDYCPTVCAKPTISGIVITENRVDSVTRFTESFASLSNLAANIVVAAATGADAEITQVISTLPLIPQSIIPPKASTGTTISLNSTQIKPFPSLNAEVYSGLP